MAKTRITPGRATRRGIESSQTMEMHGKMETMYVITVTIDVNSTSGDVRKMSAKK